MAGIDDSAWLLKCLGHAFAFKTSAPLRVEGQENTCTFQLAYGSHFTKKPLGSLFLSIPEVKLSFHPGGGI
jgi:hypothetical protein